jgi:hypothetical protein
MTKPGGGDDSDEDDDDFAAKYDVDAEDLEEEGAPAKPPQAAVAGRAGKDAAASPAGGKGAAAAAQGAEVGAPQPQPEQQPVAGPEAGAGAAVAEDDAPMAEAPAAGADAPAPAVTASCPTTTSSACFVPATAPSGPVASPVPAHSGGGASQSVGAAMEVERPASAAHGAAASSPMEEDDADRGTEASRPEIPETEPVDSAAQTAPEAQAPTDAEQVAEVEEAAGQAEPAAAEDAQPPAAAPCATPMDGAEARPSPVAARVAGAALVAPKPVSPRINAIRQSSAPVSPTLSPRRAAAIAANQQQQMNRRPLQMQVPQLGVGPSAIAGPPAAKAHAVLPFASSVPHASPALGQAAAKPAQAGGRAVLTQLRVPQPAQKVQRIAGKCELGLAGSEAAARSGGERSSAGALGALAKGGGLQLSSSAAALGGMRPAVVSGAVPLSRSAPHANPAARPIGAQPVQAAAEGTKVTKSAAAATAGPALQPASEPKQTEGTVPQAPAPMQMEHAKEQQSAADSEPMDVDRANENNSFAEAASEAEAPAAAPAIAQQTPAVPPAAIAALPVARPHVASVTAAPAPQATPSAADAAEAQLAQPPKPATTVPAARVASVPAALQPLQPQPLRPTQPGASRAAQNTQATQPRGAAAGSKPRTSTGLMAEAMGRLQEVRGRALSLGFDPPPPMHD